eukprot:SAG25_NODE_382_length_8794_cov_3.620012_9_plen_82_part_00
MGRQAVQEAQPRDMAEGQPVCGLVARERHRAGEDVRAALPLSSLSAVPRAGEGDAAGRPRSQRTPPGALSAPALAQGWSVV